MSASLTSGQVRELWSTFRDFSPRTMPSRCLLFDMDRFLDARSELAYREILQTPALGGIENGRKWSCDVNWSHENSARYYKNEGYLVSIRNFNKVILIGEDGRMKWSVGMDPDDTYRVESHSGFSMQHDASLLDREHLLIFDNHTLFRGYTVPYDNQLNRIKIYRLEQNQARLEWEFQIPARNSMTRGSVSPLANGNFLAYLPESGRVAAKVIEISRAHNRVEGRMDFLLPDDTRGLQVRPLDAITDEEPLTTGLESRKRVPTTEQIRIVNARKKESDEQLLAY